jgi:hypothetical protein
MLELMQPLFRFHVNGMSNFRRWVGSEVNKLAPNSDCGLVRNAVLFLLGSNAKQSRFASLSGLSQILAVLRKVGLAQILNPIVVNNSVDVVNQINGPSSVNIEPRKPVRRYRNFVDTNPAITVLVKASRDRAFHFFAARLAPSKNARFGVVMQKVFKYRLGDSISGFSHVIAPFQRWIGQRIEGVTSTFFPRFNIEGIA